MVGVFKSQAKAWNLMSQSLVSFYEYMEENKETYEHDEVYLEPSYEMLQTENEYGI